MAGAALAAVAVAAPAGAALPADPSSGGEVTASLGEAAPAEQGTASLGEAAVSEEGSARLEEAAPPDEGATAGLGEAPPAETALAVEGASSAPVSPTPVEKIDEALDVAPASEESTGSESETGSGGVEATDMLAAEASEASVASVEPQAAGQLPALVPLPIRPGDEPPSDYADCLNGEGAKTPQGRVHNRFLWCQENTVTVKYVRRVDYLRVPGGAPATVGTVRLTYQAVVAGRMDDRSARVYLRTQKDAVDIDGFNLIDRHFSVPDLQFWIMPECTQTVQFCNAAPSAVHYPYAVWDHGTDWARWDIFSRAEASTVADKVLRHDWRFRFSGEGGDWGYTEGVTQNHRLRCDSANYFENFGIDYPAACINDDVVPHLIYRVSDTRLRSVALHIRDAQNTPDKTFPFVGAGKEIPGRYTGSRSDPGLTRVPYDGSVYNDNSAEKDKACQARGQYVNQTNFGWRPPTSGQQCDEYPFASTDQGAGNYTGNFSVRVVPKGENGSAGSVLRYYYFSDRILYSSDTFYVEIVD